MDDILILKQLLDKKFLNKEERERAEEIIHILSVELKSRYKENRFVCFDKSISLKLESCKYDESLINLLLKEY